MARLVDHDRRRRRRSSTPVYIRCTHICAKGCEYTPQSELIVGRSRTNSRSILCGVDNIRPISQTASTPRSGLHSMFGCPPSTKSILSTIRPQRSRNTLPAAGLAIVKTYEDAAKSGLRFEGRKGLQRLIADVKSGETDFDTILVYDVSRWGRFQDVDESAYYEFVCKHAGIKVHYCAEQFDNDGSLTASVLKSIKRAMAGEYSRELSVKVFNGQSRVCSLGFKAGGSSGYGLRRHFVDQHGKHKGELGRGECKSLQTDRVILAPGPKHEIETVQKIYRLFVIDRLPQTEIARVLNRDGILTEEGRAWTFGKVHGILTNEKYVGNLLYNRKSQKLHGPPVSNPPELWIRHDARIRTDSRHSAFRGGSRDHRNAYL